MRYCTSFIVSADPRAAFDYLADGRNGLWSHPPGTTVDQIPPGSPGLGTLFIFRRPSGPEYRSTITAFEPTVRLAVLGGFEGESPAEATWTFSADGAGTRLTVDTQSGFLGPRLVRPFAGLLTIAAWPLLVLKLWGQAPNLTRARPIGRRSGRQTL